MANYLSQRLKRCATQNQVFAMAIDQRSPESSNVRLGRYGKSPAIPRCLGRNLDDGCGLLALIFAALDHADDAPHQGDVEPSFLGDSLRRMGILNVVIQNYIENFIGREEITIFLSGTQLSRWRLLQARLRDDRPPRVHVTAQAVHKSLGDI